MYHFPEMIGLYSSLEKGGITDGCGQLKVYAGYRRNYSG